METPKIVGFDNTEGHSETGSLRWEQTLGEIWSWFDLSQVRLGKPNRTTKNPTPLDSGSIN